MGILQLVQQILERFQAAVQNPVPRGKNEKQKEENRSVMILGSKDGRQTAVLMVGSTGTVEEDSGALVRKETPLIVAAKMGILEMVKEILGRFRVAIEDLDSSGKNVLMLAAEYRQTTVFNHLIDKNLPVYVFHQLDKQGNSIVHLAAHNGEELEPWPIPSAALQMQWEIKWYKMQHVKKSIPSQGFAHHSLNGDTERKIFKQTHQMLLKEGSEWLIKTYESCSVVAALVAGAVFDTSATVPRRTDENSGHLVLRNRTAFDVFSITSLVALCLSITPWVFFFSIITSRCQERDFKLILPRKLLMGLSSLFAAITAMLFSFCVGHTFILTDKLKYTAVPIHAVTSVPVALFAFAQVPLYFDLLRTTFMAVPLRSYKVFHQ